MLSGPAIVIGLLFGLFALMLLTRSRSETGAPPAGIRSELQVSDTSIATVLLAVTLLVGAIHGWNGILQNDEAIFVVTNISVADGNLPYVAAFDNTGPLGSVAGAPGVLLGRLTHIGAVEGVRLWYLILASGLGSLVFGLARTIDVSKRWALVASISVLAIPTVNRELLSGPRPKLLITVAFLGIAICFVRRRWLLGGLLVGVAGLFWQPAWLIGSAVVVASRDESPARQALNWIIAASGALLTVALAFLPFLFTGNVGTFVQGIVAYNFKYLAGRSQEGLLERVLNPLRDVWGAHQASWPIVVFGMAALLPFIGPKIRSKAINPRGASVLSAMAVLFVLWTLFDYQGVVDLVPIFGIVGVGFATFVQNALSSTGSNQPAALALVALVAIAGFELTRTIDSALPVQRSRYAVFQGIGPVVSYGDPVALALTDSVNPNPVFFRIPGRDPYLRESGGYELYVADLLASDPALLAGANRGRPPSLECYLQKEMPKRGYIATEFGWVDEAYSSSLGSSFETRYDPAACA